MKKAIIEKLEKMAAKSNQRIKTAALVLKDRENISIDNNYQETPDVTGHAELKVLKEACQKLNSKDLEGCEIYSVFEPCEMCLNAIALLGIKKVYFLNPLSTEERKRNLGKRNSVKIERIR